MKRKVLAGLLTTMMIASMAMPVAAADHSGTTTLTTSKTSEYTLTIPAQSMDITYNVIDTALGNLSVTGNVNVGEKVTVSVETHAFERKNSTTDMIAFNLMDTTVSGSPKVYEDIEWLEDDLRATPAKTVPLSVNIPQANWDNAKAGEYTGSIVFTATLN